MPMPGKVIITAAITGGVHVPSQSPYLPITPDQIVDECVRAGEAGAAVAHIHVRDPENGRPVPSMELFRDVAERVKQRSNIVLCTTTGGAPGMTHEERVGVVRELSPELASCNMGSMNFSLAPLAESHQGLSERLGAAVPRNEPRTTSSPTPSRACATSSKR